MKGASEDVFNSGTNWRQIRDMYDNAPNSFSNYISAISEGKAKVVNYFPQEYTSNGIVRVKTYEMSQESYSTDAAMLTEIIRAINAGIIPVNTSAVKLDYQNTGVLDNLTVIVQGGTINGNAHAYHAEHNDNANLLGSNPALLVSHYNAIPSAYLVNADSTQVNVNPQQGVISHEFLHTLGFTDLYPYAGSGKPVWMWDIMAANVASPQYPLSYSRAQKGWISSEEITVSGDYTLTAVTETGGTRLFTVKTPLPEGDSETICLEYRIKDKDYQAAAFECHIPGTGLLMYRVDDKVEGKANSAGANYLYVYRPGDSDDKIDSAALGSDASITSFGSTDLNNGNKADNILYYSDGQNSGVKISNISMNGKQLTFHIEFSDYSQSVWDSLGTLLVSDVSPDAYLYTDSYTGQLYAAYVEGGGNSCQVIVKAWNETNTGGSWEQVGSSINVGNNGSHPTVAVCNGELYLSYSTGASIAPVVAKLNNGVWNNVFTVGTTYSMDQQLIVDGSEIYLVYTGNAQQLYIYDVKTGGLIAAKSGQHIASPAVVKWGSKFYVAYSDWFSNDERAVIESYDTTTAVWNVEHTYSMNRSNIHDLQVHNNRLYAYLGTGSTNPVISVYDGNSWMDQAVTCMTSYTMSSMLVINDVVYLAYVDGNRGKLIKQEGSAFTSLNDNLGLNLTDLSVCSYGGTVYVGTKSDGTTTLVVRRKVVSTGGGTGTGGSPIAPPETPPVTPGSDVLKLIPPAGYDNNIIYIDGVEYVAERSGDCFSVRLDNTSAQTAVMYSYNENNIPIGMYVWRLSYQNGYFTATPLPGLENLISYHGFSIRVTSPAGIRFKSGIDAGVKQQLINNNVDGYKLVEYGTLFITDANREKYPFVKDGTKVGGGRAYWMENGRINDKVFETVGGRNRFASVLINLSEKQYATNIAFRGYIILENNEGTITLYGPPVSRSIYSVAKQVLNRGEFPVGSSGYNYVRGIVNKVEGK